MTTSLAKMTSSKISTFFFFEADFCKRDTRMFNAKQLEDSTWCWRTPLNIDWLSQGSTYFLLTISRSSERGVKKLVTSSHSEMCLGSVIKSYTINTILRVSNITYKRLPRHLFAKIIGAKYSIFRSERNQRKNPPYINKLQLAILPKLYRHFHVGNFITLPPT